LIASVERGLDCDLTAEGVLPVTPKAKHPLAALEHRPHQVGEATDEMELGLLVEVANSSIEIATVPRIEHRVDDLDVLLRHRAQYLARKWIQEIRPDSFAFESIGHVVECAVDDVECACAAEGREELFVEPADGRLLVSEGPEVVLLSVGQRLGHGCEDCCDVPRCVGLGDTPVGEPAADVSR
jgi:hypothetical protein